MRRVQVEAPALNFEMNWLQSAELVVGLYRLPGLCGPNANKLPFYSGACNNYIATTPDEKQTALGLRRPLESDRTPPGNGAPALLAQSFPKRTRLLIGKSRSDAYVFLHTTKRARN